MLLPFDPLGPRALSITLLALIVLVTVVDNGPRTTSLVSGGSKYVNCYGADAARSFKCQKGGRNTVAGGHLSVGKGF